MCIRDSPLVVVLQVLMQRVVVQQIMDRWA